jgi:hypothetical protein
MGDERWRNYGIGCGAPTRNFNFWALSIQYNLYISETVILTCFNRHVVVQNIGTYSDVWIWVKVLIYGYIIFEKSLAPARRHEAIFILSIKSSGVTCELHCYLALSARCMWSDTYICPRVINCKTRRPGIVCLRCNFWKVFETVNV